MSADFNVVRRPDDAALNAVAGLSGGRCHYAPEFLRAAAGPGAELVLFTVSTGDVLIAAAVGFERRGRLFSQLTLPTQPVFTSGADLLWQGISDYGRSRRIAAVGVHSFEGSALLEPPPSLGRLTSRTPREEFVIDLATPLEQLLAACSENHRRNIKKAVKQGLDVQFVTTAAAAEQHADLFRHSMERRAARGEDVGLETDAALVRRLLAARAGVLAQVRRDNDVLTSLLILTTASHGYYHSGGSAPEGMKVGASHFAMWRTMEMLRSRGVRSFCLGGASAKDSAGLTAFKLGFSPRRIALAHLRYELDLPFPWNVARRLLGR